MYTCRNNQFVAPIPCSKKWLQEKELFRVSSFAHSYGFLFQTSFQKGQHNMASTQASCCTGLAAATTINRDVLCKYNHLMISHKRHFGEMFPFSWTCNGHTNEMNACWSLHMISINVKMKLVIWLRSARKFIVFLAIKTTLP